MANDDFDPKSRIVDIFLHPPMAIARVGPADEPVAAYDWALDRTAFGGSETIIQPRTTLSVADDGSIFAALPDTVSFKDEEGQIRPVAPFLELHATLRLPDGTFEDHPVTEALLKSQEATLADIRFEVIAANRKAESRTKSASCAAIARVDVLGNDHQRKPLLASSPHDVGETPMVDPARPLKLGHVQVVKPHSEIFEGGALDEQPVNLGTLRLRFTPAGGATFGPPEAGKAPASPLAPGEDAPARSLYGRLYDVVPEENRIFNSPNPYLGFSYEEGGTAKWPTPIDSYDGSRVGNRECWGNIDDACDATIEVELVARGRRFGALGRVFVGPPDFAPDRRPFYSMMAELEDRDLADVEVDEDSRRVTEEELVQLFRRIFETSSLLNLDQRRAWALSGNAGQLDIKNADSDWDMETTPKIGPHSMRSEDKPYADKMPDYTPSQTATVVSTSGPDDRLPYTEAVSQIHGPLADAPILLEFLARRAARVRELIRPPYARFADLPTRADFGSAAPWRDPRTTDGQLYDMRMPPYMRHSMGVPLSITQRQYRMLMAYLDLVEGQRDMMPGQETRG